MEVIVMARIQGLNMFDLMGWNLKVQYAISFFNHYHYIFKIKQNYVVF